MTKKGNNHELLYFISKIDENNRIIDISTDELYALNDVSVIYIYCSKDLKKYYIGQTNSFIRRHNEHIKEIDDQISDSRFELFKGGTVIIFYNDSIWSNLNYVENSLIKLFKNWESIYGQSYKIEVLNSTLGNKSDLLQKERETIDFVVQKILYVLKNKELLIFPINNMDGLKAILYRNSPFYDLSKKQNEILDNILCKDENVFIIRGGAGTGKTVLLTHLIARFLGQNIKNIEENAPVKKIGVCLKVNAKNQIKEIFHLFEKNLEKYGLYINTFDKLIDDGSEMYDYILIDESHRLLKYSDGLFPPYYKNFLKKFKVKTALSLFLSKSNKTVLFYDECQTIRPSDIGNIGSKNNYSPQSELVGKNVLEQKLDSQYRIKIKQDSKDYNIEYANNYIKYLKYMLKISEEKPSNLDFLEYDYFKLCDSINDVKKYVDDKRKKFPNKTSSIIAGMCRKHDKDKHRKQKGEFAWKEINMGWNKNHENWATEGNLKEEVGTVHSVQGYDFDFVGVIIGKDLEYRNKEVRVNRYNYYDKNGKQGIPRSDNQLLGKYIKNIYYTLLTRGIYGIRVYIEDEELRKYWKEKTEELKESL